MGQVSFGHMIGIGRELAKIIANWIWTFVAGKAWTSAKMYTKKCIWSIISSLLQTFGTLCLWWVSVHKKEKYVKDFGTNV